MAIDGSVGAGWTLPAESIAHDAIVCSPDAGVPQSNVQNLHAKPLDFLWFEPRSFARVHSPPSIETSTVLIEAPRGTDDGES